VQTLGNLTPRLKLVSRDGPDPEVQFGDKEYVLLEDSIGSPISDEARCALEILCNSYLCLRGAELAARPVSDMVKIFSRVKRAIAEFNQFSYGRLTPALDDASAELEGMLSYHLAQMPVAIPNTDIVDPADTAGRNEFDREKQGSTLLRLTGTNLMNIGISLAAAVDRTEDELRARQSGEAGLGFAPGQALKTFLPTLHNWAKERNLPSSIGGGDYDATPFCRFVFCLNGLLPQNLREPIASPEAVAQRLKRINAEAKKSLASTDSLGSRA
jgi:hypothetical protein